MDSDRRYVMEPGDHAVTRRESAGDGPMEGEPGREEPVRGKPTLAQLGVDPADLDWQRSGTGAGSLEVAFVAGTTGGESARADWVLLRVSGDSDGRVLVYDRTEWMCFLDGVGQGEFG